MNVPMSRTAAPKANRTAAEGEGTPASRWFARSRWEPASMVLIGLGLAMLMQPWSLDIYSWSFAVLLAGVAGYTIAGKLH
jgi:hypothetical protein